MTKHKISLNPQFISANGAQQFAVISMHDFETMRQTLIDAENLINVNSAKYREAEKISQIVVEAKQQSIDISSKLLDLG